MTLNEKYNKWVNILGETGTPTYYYTLWTQLIKSAPNAIATYCPALLSSTKFTDDDIRALDIYLHTHYGARNVMNWFETLDIGTSNTTAATSTQTAIRTNIAHTIFELFGSKWNVLLEVLGTYKQITEDNKYSPVENVFEVSDTTRTKKGKEIRTRNGEREIIKSGTETKSIAGDVITEEQGNEKVAVDYGAGTSESPAYTVTHNQDHHVDVQVSAFDSNTFVNQQRQIVSDGNGSTGNGSGSGNSGGSGDKDVTTGGYTTTTSFGVGSAADPSRKSITSYGTGANAHKESIDFGAIEAGVDRRRKDTESFTNYSETLQYGETSGETTTPITEEESTERHGNIGTMTSGQILEGEWTARCHLIYKAMCEDLIGYLSSPVYTI